MCSMSQVRTTIRSVFITEEIPLVIETRDIISESIVTFKNALIQRIRKLDDVIHFLKNELNERINEDDSIDKIPNTHTTNPEDMNNYSIKSCRNNVERGLHGSFFQTLSKDEDVKSKVQKWPLNTLRIASGSTFNQIYENRLSRIINVKVRSFIGALIEELVPCPLLKKEPDFFITSSWYK